LFNALAVALTLPSDNSWAILLIATSTSLSCSFPIKGVFSGIMFLTAETIVFFTPFNAKEFPKSPSWVIAA